MNNYDLLLPDIHEGFCDVSHRGTWNENGLLLDVPDLNILMDNDYDAEEIARNFESELRRAAQASTLLARIYRAMPYIYEGESISSGRQKPLHCPARNAAELADFIVAWLTEKLLFLVAPSGESVLRKAEDRMAKEQASQRWKYIWGPPEPFPGIEGIRAALMEPQPPVPWSEIEARYERTFKAWGIEDTVGKQIHEKLIHDPEGDKFWAAALSHKPEQIDAHWAEEDTAAWFNAHNKAGEEDTASWFNAHKKAYEHARGYAYNEGGAVVSDFDGTHIPAPTYESHRDRQDQQAHEWGVRARGLVQAPDAVLPLDRAATQADPFSGDMVEAPSGVTKGPFERLADAMDLPMPENERELGMMGNAAFLSSGPWLSIFTALFRAGKFVAKAAKRVGAKGGNAGPTAEGASAKAATGSEVSVEGKGAQPVPKSDLQYSSAVERERLLEYGWGDAKELEQFHSANKGLAPYPNAPGKDRLAVSCMGRVNGKPVVTSGEGKWSIGRGAVGEKRAIDKNQKAYPPEKREARPTLIAEEATALGKKKYGEQTRYPNDTLGNAHAEVAYLQRLYEGGLVKKGDTVTLSVAGKAVCDNCVEHLPLMAEKIGLRFMTVTESVTGITYYWHPGMKELLRLP